MATSGSSICPKCKGKKVIPGECICDVEWRGTQSGDEWNDCICAREQECPICRGTGHVEQ